MLIVKAINFAAEKHRGQERRGTELPYVIHPIIVAHLLGKYKKSTRLEELQVAALLHDVLEDTECTYIEIERGFGPLVASIVMELTSDDEAIKIMGKNEYLKQKMIKMSKYAFVVKLIDRFSNILDKPGKKYAENTINMMAFLESNREDITETQLVIIKDIVAECHKFLGTADEYLDDL